MSIEKKLERQTSAMVRAAGGEAIKYASGEGMPDRLFILPPDAHCVGARYFWVEFKDTGKTPSPLQEHRIKKLKALNADVRVVDSKASQQQLLNDMRIG